jgi:hypothetical protein
MISTTVNSRAPISKMISQLKPRLKLSKAIKLFFGRSRIFDASIRLYNNADNGMTANSTVKNLVRSFIYKI